MRTDTGADSPEYLSVAIAAARLGCAEMTIRRMIAQGDLRAYRFGRLIRIKPSDLEKAFKPVTNLHKMRGGGDV